MDYFDNLDCKSLFFEVQEALFYDDVIDIDIILGIAAERGCDITPRYVAIMAMETNAYNVILDMVYRGVSPSYLINEANKRGYHYVADMLRSSISSS